MKITFVVPTLNLSGGQRVVSIYAKLLVEKGHVVTIISPKERIPTFKERIKQALRWKGYKFKKYFDTTFFENSGCQVVSSKSEYQVLQEDMPDADVVIATWWRTAEWVNLFSDKKGKKVYFIQHHETHVGLPIERVKNTYRLPLHKITIANWLVYLLEKKYASMPPYLVPNSVDHELFYAGARKKQSTPTIGFLFSETEFKGVDIALKVIQKLKTKIPNLRVIAFGQQAPMAIDLPEYIELSISPKQEDIRLLYQQCDLWLCCSVIEGFGLTILEAMACRTPSVSTKSGGPEDIVTEGVNGYLCDIDDVEALAVASQRVLDFSEQEWLEFSNHAYKHAKGYSWNDAADLFETALQHIIDL